MNTLHTATAASNEGVRLLNAGDHAAGIQAFQRALVLVRAAADARTATAAAASLPAAAEAACIFPSTSNWATAAKLASSDDDHRKYSTATQLFCSAIRGEQLAGLQSDHYYVYNRPLVLPTKTMPIASPGEFEAVVGALSTSILFNAALACHQHGRLTGRAFFLERAGQLYEFIATKTSRGDDVAAQHHQHLLQCLALNNLFQLHDDQGDRPPRVCQMYLHRLCGLLAAAPGCLGRASYLNERDVGEILLNLNLALHMHPPSGARAA